MNTNAQANEALAVIRRAAAALPLGKRNQVLNRCNRIDLILRRVPAGESGLVGATSPAEADNRTDAQKAGQIADNYNTAQRIIAALISGRVLSQRNSAEFKTIVWHSRMHDVRRILARQYPQYTLCSRFSDERTAAGKPFKLYWIENAAQ